MRGPGPFEVIIAGAGVAGLETAIALTKRAPGCIRLTLVAPDDRLRFRPGLVLGPFGGSNGDGYSLELIARELGAEPRPRYEDAITIGDRAGDRSEVCFMTSATVGRSMWCFSPRGERPGPCPSTSWR
jgi:glycine/D-amino acid oxidase-like deaminating enzyme